jgi:hypothetical protein
VCGPYRGIHTNPKILQKYQCKNKLEETGDAPAKFCNDTQKSKRRKLNSKHK